MTPSVAAERRVVMGGTRNVQSVAPCTQVVTGGVVQAPVAVQRVAAVDALVPGTCCLHDHRVVDVPADRSTGIEQTGGRLARDICSMQVVERTD